MGEVPASRHHRLREPDRYDIRIGGHLAHRWDAYFDGMTVTAQDDGTTVIAGPVADQSALHGLLRTIADLGLPLLCVTPVPDTHPTRSTT